MDHYIGNKTYIYDANRSEPIYTNGNNNSKTIEQLAAEMVYYQKLIG